MPSAAPGRDVVKSWLRRLTHRGIEASLRARRSGPHRVVRAAGDLTEAERVRRLLEQGRRAIAEAGRARVRGRLTVDLGGVRVADTKVIACVILLQRIGRRRSVPVDVEASPAVQRVAEICRVRQIILAARPEPR